MRRWMYPAFASACVGVIAVAVGAVAATRRPASVVVIAAVAADVAAMGTGECMGTATVPALVTVQTAGPERFVVRVVQQTVLDQMIAICQGLSPPKIVIGPLRTGTAGYNEDPPAGRIRSWHMDSVGLADFTIELCDGIPSMVEADLEYWVETVRNFCPWTSQIVAVRPDTSLAADFDIDGDIDLGDYGLLQSCVPDPWGLSALCYAARPGCCGRDLDADRAVDAHDGGRLAGAMTSPVGE